MTDRLKKALNIIKIEHRKIRFIHRDPAPRSTRIRIRQKNKGIPDPQLGRKNSMNWSNTTVFAFEMKALIVDSYSTRKSFMAWFMVSGRRGG